MPPKTAKDEQVSQIISSAKDEAQQIDQIASVRGWFRPGEDSSYYPAVQSYAEGKADLSSILTQITPPINEALAANKSSEVDWLDLWYSIIHASKRIPYRDHEKHTKLVELVKSLKQDLKGPGLEQKEEDSSTNLPNFGMAIREAANDCPGCGAGYTEPEAAAWANYNYFLATLTANSVFEIPIYAIWALRDALEDEHSENETGWTEYDAHVPAAAAWVFAMGNKLHDREEDLTPTNPNQGNPGRGGKLWQGGPVFSKERWSFWKNR